MVRETADYGTDGQAATARASREEHVEVRGNAKRLRYEQECLLDALWAAKVITQGQYDAGMWLKERWHEAGRSAGRAARLEPRPDIPGVSWSDHEAEDWNGKAYDDALKALPDYAGVLTDICCLDRLPKLPEDRAIQAVKRALENLRLHRGLFA